jgi:5-formyltetrahydrofolate cyclo-ligase
MGPREMDRAAEQALRARAKQELRVRMRSVRRVLPQTACVARSQAICEQLRELSPFALASTLIAYAAYRKEADPAPLLREAERLGKTVGLVRVEEDGGLGLHRYRTGDPLADNAFGIAEPSSLAARIEHAEVELVIVPVLAIDPRGYRIGYGHGYYDRLLPRLGRAFKVAIAYDFQLLAEMPNTDGDVPVDCIVTDKRTLLVSDGQPTTAC